MDDEDAWLQCGEIGADFEFSEQAAAQWAEEEAEFDRRDRLVASWACNGGNEIESVTDEGVPNIVLEKKKNFQNSGGGTQRVCYIRTSPSTVSQGDGWFLSGMREFCYLSKCDSHILRPKRPREDCCNSIGGKRARTLTCD